jgi:hypothetical protein
MRAVIFKPLWIKTILFLQLFPLVLFPPSSFSPSTQEWWLPVLLGVMVLVAIVQLLFVRTFQMWPWYLLSFAQGFNIISRLMLLMPHATVNQNGVQVFNTPYVSLTLVSILISSFLLWYMETPEVRQGVTRG